MRSPRSRPCPECGAGWPGPRARFCGRCGSPLPTTGRSVSDLPARRRLVIALVVLLGALAALGVALVAWPALPRPGDDVTTSLGGAPTDPGTVTLPDAGAPTDTTTPASGDALVGCEGCRGWRLAVSDPLTSLAADGRDVVIATSGGRVLAVDGDTGEPRWSAQIGDDAAHAVVLDDLVVVGTADARVVALDRASGRFRWDVRVPIATSGARAVAGDRDGVLLAGGTEAGVVALDGRTGALRWVRDLPGRSVGVGAMLVTVTADRQLQGWWAAADQPRWSALLVADEELVGRAGDLVVTRGPAGPRFRDAMTGTVVADGTPSVTWWAAADDGTLLLADTGPRTEVVALDQDGAERWRTRLPGDEPAPGCCVEVAPTADGRVLAIDRRTQGRASLLDLATGAVLADAGRAAAAIPGMLLIGAHGDLGVLQGEGSVAGVALTTGDARWRTTDASVLAGLDPLVVGGRRHLLGPWSAGAD
jgi:outer membrane protein assembly factor BamB